MNVKCTIVYIHNVPKVEPFSTSTSPRNKTVLEASGSNKANDSIMKNDMNIRHKAKNVITDETKHLSELAWIYNYINASITNLNGTAILEVYTIVKCCECREAYTIIQIARICVSLYPKLARSTTVTSRKRSCTEIQYWHTETHQHHCQLRK